MNLQLHLTDDTQLRAHGFVADGTLFAEVCWEVPLPGSHGSQGTLWGTPAMLRQLAALATQAAIQAEEEAAWQAHQATHRPNEGADGMTRLLEAALGYAAPRHPRLPRPLAPPHPGWGQPGLHGAPRSGL